MTNSIVYFSQDEVTEHAHQVISVTDEFQGKSEFGIIYQSLADDAEEADASEWFRDESSRDSKIAYMVTAYGVRRFS